MERHGGRMREREATEIDPLREKREAKRDNKQNRTEQNRTEHLRERRRTKTIRGNPRVDI